MSSSPLAAIAVSLALVLIAGRAWSWQRGIFRARRDDVRTEPWEAVTKQYPTSEEIREPAALSKQMLDQVVRADPFSASRRAPSATAPTPGTALAPAQASAPQFRFKGHINMGSRQRAILEDTAVHKTYFLEVGQEVAGFKVLDILENRVVLSDPQTHQELVVTLVEPTKP